MTYLMAIFAGFCSLIRKHNRIVTGIWIILMTFISAFNSTCADRQYYIQSYHQGVGNYEIGYTLAERIFAQMGISVFLFFFVLFAVSYTMLAYAVNSMMKETNLFLCLYFIYPFFVNAVQIRTFVAMVLELLAFTCFFRKKGWNIWKYVMLTLLASSFHMSYVFFLIFILVYKMRIEKLRLLCIGGTSFLLILSYWGILKRVFLLLFPGWEKLGYWMTAQVRFGILLPCAAILAGCLLTRRMFYDAQRWTEETEYLEIGYKINLVSIVLLGLISFNLQFIRLYRIVVLVNYILVVKFLLNRKYRVKYRALYLILGAVGLMVLLEIDQKMVGGILMNENLIFKRIW